MDTNDQESEETQGEETLDENAFAEQQDQQTEQEGTSTGEDNVVKLAPETLAAIAAIQQPQQQAPEPQMTPEQVRDLLGQFELQEADMEPLGLPPAAVEHMNEFKQKMVREAVRTASVQMEMLKREFNQQLTPLLEQHQRAQAEKVKSDFYAANQDLVGLDDLVEATYAKLSQTIDFTKLTQDQAFKTVAESVRRAKTALLGGGQQTQQTTSGKPTSLSGGRSGGKIAKKLSSQEEEARAIFG